MSAFHLNLCVYAASTRRVSERSPRGVSLPPPRRPICQSQRQLPRDQRPIGPLASAGTVVRGFLTLRPEIIGPLHIILIFKLRCGLLFCPGLSIKVIFVFGAPFFFVFFIPDQHDRTAQYIPQYIIYLYPLNESNMSETLMFFDNQIMSLMEIQRKSCWKRFKCIRNVFVFSSSLLLRESFPMTSLHNVPRQDFEKVGILNGVGDECYEILNGFSQRNNFLV